MFNEAFKRQKNLLQGGIQCTHNFSPFTRILPLGEFQAKKELALILQIIAIFRVLNDDPKLNKEKVWQLFMLLVNDNISL